MDRASLSAMLPQLKQELVAANRKVREAAHERDALQEIIAGIERLVGADVPLQDETLSLLQSATTENGGATSEALIERVVDENPAPRGATAVLEILSDGRPWKQQAIVAEVLRRGWIKPDARDPGAAVRATVRRLESEGKLEKTGHATYRLAPPVQTVPPTFTDPNIRDPQEPDASIGVQT